VTPPSQTEVWEGLKAPPREDRHDCPSLARGYHEVVGVDKIYKYIRRVFQPSPFPPKQKYRRDLKPYEYKNNL